ncbi:tetratricopeptide repeat-containing sensor histidine kinase [Fluviicola taffensis]|uniref:histidine kinase n=1 Tax=Fluviicola taffensis (strain DSM 16823 / NCIMB 13979 / RW262) TaxID=755732 RepID=F2IJX7_FLUTR|nr:tetratricopeptide repeat-containing sensor histidine kinase [Fluviicola taffensis]AEA45036.1 putative signal transduction histidine kinase [Fluviicola taffensis DSM 16823]
MNNRFANFLGITLVLLLNSCSETDTRVIYHKETSVDVDKTCTWLSKRAYFHDADYYSVFRNYYEKQLKNTRFDKAAIALSELTEQEMYFSFFQKSTLDTVRSFQKMIEPKLSWDSTLFVESYIGNYYINQSKYRQAIPYFRKITVNKPFNYNTCVEVAHGYGDMAFCYFAMGQQGKALRYNSKALALFNQTTNYTGRGGIYDNMALVNLYSKNYPEAEVCFDKAMADYKRVNDMGNVFISLHNKIILYQEMEDPRLYELIDSTYHLFKKSKIADESLEVALSSFYVDMLLHEGRNSEAKAVLFDMKKNVDKLNSVASDADYIIALANYQIKAGEGIKDIKLIEKALKAVEEQDDYQNQIAFGHVLKDNAVLTKNYEKAYLISEKLKDAENMINNQKMITKTLELNKLYETKRKERQINNQKEVIASGRITIALLVSALMGFFLIIVVVSFRQKQKKNRSENRRALRYTKQLLLKTEEERKRIASDLHDSVSHDLLNLKNSIGGNASPAGEKIDTIINDIRSISRNLHPVMFEKVGLSASVEQLVDRAQSVNRLMVTSDIVYHGSLSVSNELQVYRIIQEALSNIIKYAEAVAAKIIIREETNHLQIQIKDNGLGFNVLETLSRKDAFGLHNIIERSKAIGGVAKIQSDKNGTIITIDLKKTP